MRCPRCGEFAEDIEHLIIECSWSKLVWERMQSHIGLNLSNYSLSKWWEVLMGEGMRKGSGQTLVAYSAWAIWKQRNKWLFEREAPTVDAVVREVLEQEREREREMVVG